MKKFLDNLKIQLILAIVILTGGYMLCALFNLIETILNIVPTPLLIIIVCYILYKFMRKEIEEW